MTASVNYYLCLFITLAIYITIITLNTENVLFVTQVDNFPSHNTTDNKTNKSKLILDWTRFYASLDEWWKVNWCRK